MVASPQAPAQWTPIRMAAAGMALKAGYPHRQGPDVNPQRKISGGFHGLHLHIPVILSVRCISVKKEEPRWKRNI